ncbi:unnamed protein product, partial [Discosporangium mesarthrocarpum]
MAESTPSGDGVDPTKGASEHNSAPSIRALIEEQQRELQMLKKACQSSSTVNSSSRGASFRDGHCLDEEERKGGDSNGTLHRRQSPEETKEVNEDLQKLDDDVARETTAPWPPVTSPPVSYSKVFPPPIPSSAGGAGGGTFDSAKDTVKSLYTGSHSEALAGLGYVPGPGPGPRSPPPKGGFLPNRKMLSLSEHGRRQVTIKESGGSHLSQRVQSSPLSEDAGNSLPARGGGSKDVD